MGKKHRVFVRVDKTDGIGEAVSEEEVIAKTEGKGYYAKDTVLPLLLKGIRVETPFAIYGLM